MPTRRRRRSRSPSPGRINKRARSRSRDRDRDRRGRDVALPPVNVRGGVERFAEPPVSRHHHQHPQRERSTREERRVVRSRERIADGRHGGANTLTVSGGSARGGGGGRDREVHIRDAPPMAAEYRGGGGGGGGGMIPSRGGVPVGNHMPAPYPHGGGRMDHVRGGGPDFRGGGEFLGGGAMAMNGHARGGYPVASGGGGGRSGDRERDRERELVIVRERARDRERERERDKERLLLREREERARLREIKAIEDRRASEAHALRRESMRLRDEAALKHNRGRDGGASGVSMAAGVERERERGRDRDRDRAPPRVRIREGRGRDRVPTVGRANKGVYMSKQEVDSLFLKVLKTMGEDSTRFPCMASLINDRMKIENDGYNVVKSEYQRFANVLSRFEAEKVVGTTKAKENILVNWTKYSAPGSGTGARRPDSRRETDDTRVKIRTCYKGGPLQLYFCSADEDKTADVAAAAAVEEAAAAGADDGDGGDAKGGDGGGGSAVGVGAVAVTPFAEIASILQARGEVLMAPPPEPKKTADATAEAAAAEMETAAAAPPDGDPMEEEEKIDTKEEEEAAEEAEKPPGGEESVENKGEGKKQEADGEASDAAAAAAAKENGAETEIAEKEEEEAGGGEGKGEGLSNGNDRDRSTAREGKKEEKAAVMTELEVYQRDMSWLRSANGMVAEVSSPSLGVGYKIALMIHQRCKPCLCLFKKAKADSQEVFAASPMLSPMLTGDRNLDIHEYHNISEIGDIVDGWIKKQFPNKGPNARRARSGRGDSRDSRERSGRKRAEEEVRRGGRGKGGRDGTKEPDEEPGTGGRRRSTSDNDEDENEDAQSVTEGIGADADADASGERTESVVSDDDGVNNDEHEEVEDVTGDYATGAADAGGDGVGNGAADVDDGDVVSDDDGEE